MLTWRKLTEKLLTIYGTLIVTNFAFDPTAFFHAENYRADIIFVVKAVQWSPMQCSNKNVAATAKMCRFNNCSMELASYTYELCKESPMRRAVSLMQCILYAHADATYLYKLHFVDTTK